MAEFLVDSDVVDGQERVGENAHVPVRFVPQDLSPAGEAARDYIAIGDRS
jgi:hypothetical protein